MVNASKHSGGHGRSNARWSYGFAKKLKGGGLKGTAPCPWCNAKVTPRKTKAKPKRKKVELTILLCPKCEEVWQFRGPLPKNVNCPACEHAYDPHNANVLGSGKFVCGCGNESKVIEAIRLLPEDELLSMRAYGMECFCARCAPTPSDKRETNNTGLELFTVREDVLTPEKQGLPNSQSLKNGEPDLSNLWKNKGKFYKRMATTDLAQYQDTAEVWEEHKAELPYPKSRIPVGEKTKSGLLAHHYHFWHQMFNSRQLLALGTLLDCILKEPIERQREALLCAFSNMLEANNLFTRQISARSTPGGTPPAGIFARHDFQPKATICEQNVWGTVSGNNTFIRRISMLENGIVYAKKSWDNIDNGTPSPDRIMTGDNAFGRDAVKLTAADSRKELSKLEVASVVVTDPPYSDNVNYAELSDFFYVWLRLALSHWYPFFAPEYSPKTDEIIENRSRGLSAQDFESGLSDIFRLASEKVSDDGLIVFTFHHKEGSAWEAVLNALCNAGLEVTAVYPIHAEREWSLHLLDQEGAIAYDLIHVCRKRHEKQKEKRSWAGVRQQIRQLARAEIRSIESGRYGSARLPPPDINIILIGKCLELFSRHFGAIINHEGEKVSLHAALEEIRMLVDQLTSEASALPSELEDIDAASYVYLTCLCDRKEIKSDEVHKATRGICEPLSLMGRDLMIKGRAKRGRTYEVKQPLERLDLLKKEFGVGAAKAQQELFDEDLSADFIPGTTLIDYVHFLLALVETGESALEWLEKFRGRRPEIRAALEFMARKNRGFAESVRKVLGLMDEKTLFNRDEKESRA